MEQTWEQRIRHRAYEIWDALGRAEGDSHSHWLAAEREVLVDSVGQVALATSATRPKPAPRKSVRRAKLIQPRTRNIA
jgi:Protein of unknown function (DUF2934)